MHIPIGHQSGPTFTREEVVTIHQMLEKVKFPSIGETDSQLIKLLTIVVEMLVEKLVPSLENYCPKCGGGVAVTVSCSQIHARYCVGGGPGRFTGIMHGCGWREEYPDADNRLEGVHSGT